MLQTQDTDPVFGEVISTYTRAQSIEDGFLIDVSEVAREAGFTMPVAMTNGVWEDCVHWEDDDTKRQTYQDEAGRLWDVLSMASMAIRSANRHGHEGSTLGYSLRRVPRGGRGRMPRKRILKLVVGPGDHAEPVITIMLPNED